MQLLPRVSLCLATVVFAGLTGMPLARAADPALELKDNDVWVMAGDSITAQRQHTNFIEAYYRTRYPKLNLHFRNSGIGGNRTGNIIARFDDDIAAFKPTIVSVELGMNDVSGSVESYIKGMKEIIGKIRAVSAQPVLISSSPVDDGSIMGDWKGKRCENIHVFTDALKKLAAEENVVFVDQYHPLIDIWGQNRRKGIELATKNGTMPTPPPAPPAPTAGPDGKVPPAKPVVTPLAPSLIPLGGDTVHVGVVGQYNMAATILMGLKAGGEVSSATLSADGKIAEAKRCKITDVSASGGKLSFTRLDEAGSWPIPTKAEPAFDLLPDTIKLSQYILRVSGLAEGPYKVSIDGKPAGTVTAEELARGWNMTRVSEGVLNDRAKALYTLITKLESPLNIEWRAASKAKDADKLAAAQAAIDDVEKQIQTAVQPTALKFVIEK